MSLIVAHRANAVGHLTPTPEARAKAARMVRAGSPEHLAANRVKSALKADGQTQRVTGDSLDKDAFLRLLVLQMQNQDPLDPVSNEDMLAQLAQFSSLEQMNNLNEGMETLAGNIDQLNFISASALVGRTVSGVDLNGNVAQGIVESVHLDGSLVYLTIGDQTLSMAGVMGIE